MINKHCKESVNQDITDMLDDFKQACDDMRADWEKDMQDVDPNDPDQVTNRAMEFIFTQFSKFESEK